MEHKDSAFVPKPGREALLGELPVLPLGCDPDGGMAMRYGSPEPFFDTLLGGPTRIS